MSAPATDKHLLIGWDVGGWNCDKNTKSRDALVVLDHQCQLLGKPWRGNLRQAINRAESSHSFIRELLKLCKIADVTDSLPAVTLAIDTPLGFSESFHQLITGQGVVEQIGASASNPYLFRYTERYFFARGLTPLSPIKDMIGSQATKGIHVLNKFAPHTASVGVWTDQQVLQVIEGYPSSCKTSPTMAELLQPFLQDQAPNPAVATLDWQQAVFGQGIDHEDKRDALICALLAWLFVFDPNKLQPPDPQATAREGWIFVPKDGLQPESP